MSTVAELVDALTVSECRIVISDVLHAVHDYDVTGDWRALVAGLLRAVETAERLAMWAPA